MDATAPDRRSARTQVILAGVLVTLVLWFAGLILLDLLAGSAGSPGAVSLLQLLYDVALPVGVTAVAWYGISSTWLLSPPIPDDVEGAEDDDLPPVDPSFVQPDDRRIVVVAPLAALLADRLVWERVDERYAPLGLWQAGDRDAALFVVEAVLALVVVGVSVWAGLAARTLLAR